MKFEDNKYVPETAEEQQFFDYAFNKGVGQGKKNIVKVEEPKPDVPMFDMEAIAKLVADSVAAGVKPLYDGFSTIQANTKAQTKEKVIARQTAKLPKAYQALVDGNTEAEIKVSFDTILEQYKSELKDAGVTLSFGAPTPGADGASKDKPAKTFKTMTPAEKIELYKSDPDTYSKISQE